MTDWLRGSRMHVVAATNVGMYRRNDAKMWDGPGDSPLFCNESTDMK